MPRISVWFVRASLVHCLIGLSVGSWQLAHYGGLINVSLVALRLVHIEVMLLGWLVQLAFGVAVWILPFSREVSADRRLWSAWGLLNAGILLVVMGAFASDSVLPVIGRLAEIGAVGLVVGALWPRVRALPIRK